MKKLSSFYFIGLSVLPLLINKKGVYQVFGGIISIVCLYIFLAVFVTHIRESHQDQLQPLWTYGIGYVFNLVTLRFGLLMTGVININYKKLVVNR